MSLHPMSGRQPTNCQAHTVIPGGRSRQEAQNATRREHHCVASCPRRARRHDSEGGPRQESPGALVRGFGSPRPQNGRRSCRAFAAQPNGGAQAHVLPCHVPKRPSQSFTLARVRRARRRQRQMDDPNYKALHDSYKPMTTALVKRHACEGQAVCDHLSNRPGVKPQTGMPTCRSGDHGAPLVTPFRADAQRARAFVRLCVHICLKAERHQHDWQALPYGVFRAAPGLRSCTSRARPHQRRELIDRHLAERRRLAAVTLSTLQPIFKDGMWHYVGPAARCRRL
jgi:hypothetical protein